MKRKLVSIPILAALLLAALLLPFSEMNRSSAPTSIDKALFFPTKYPVGNWKPENLRYKDVYFLAQDGTHLHGWFCQSEDATGAMLIVHGNAGHLASRAPMLRHLQSTTNISTFIFDYRGYGRSEGTPSVEGALQDARAALAKLRELASVNDSKILLMGESLGGAIAVQLATESSPRALILQSTFSSLHDLAEVQYPQHASSVPTDTLNSASIAGQYDGTLFQSHGDKDETIPIDLGRRLFQAANEPKEFIVIPNADHNNWLTDEYLRDLDKFVDKVLSE